MNSDDLKATENQWQALLSQLATAETALRNVLHAHGFGTTPRAHVERALEHVREAYVAINETKQIRSVPQLVEDLNRIQQVMDDTRRGRSQHI